MPEYRSLSLKDSAVEKRAHWEVSHEGRRVVVKKRDRSQQLVHILRDPAHKGNLIAIRRAGLANGGEKGVLTLSTVGPNGDEVQLGSMALLPEEARYKFESLGLVPFQLRKPTSVHPGVSKLQSVVKDFRSSPYARLFTDIAVESKAASARLEQFKENLSGHPFPLEVDRPSGRRVYSYRGRGLGMLLIRLGEEIAKKAGAMGVFASLDKRTTARFLFKPGTGWRKTGEGMDFAYGEKRFE